MAAMILSEMSVGLTPQIEAALRVATTWQGIKPSQYARLAIFLRLVAEGYLEHPGIVRPENNGTKNQEIKSQAAI